MRGLASFHRLILERTTHTLYEFNLLTKHASTDPNQIIFSRYKQENLAKLVHQEIEFRLWTELK